MCFGNENRRQPVFFVCHCREVRSERDDRNHHGNHRDCHCHNHCHHHNNHCHNHRRDESRNRCSKCNGRF